MKINFQNPKFKNIISKFAVIALGLLLAVSASYVSAKMSRPSDISTNVEEVLNVGDATQIKAGDMKVLAFMAGEYAKPTIGNFATISNLGIMTIGKTSTPDVSTGIALDIGGTTGVLGTIRSKDLVSGGSREVCADSSGKIIFCTKEKEFTSTSYLSDYYGLMVPDGVTSMTVELYGAGGAGFAKNNPTSGADDGQSSYLIGDNVTLIAEGGKGADLPDAGGKGGIATANGSDIDTKVTQVTINGGDGTAPGSFNSSPTQIGASDKCSGITYLVVQGANGNTGGKGGKPYNGANANGGSNGTAAQTYGTFKGSAWNFNTTSNFIKDPVDCNYAGQTSDNFVAGQYINNRPGGDGEDGASYGAGGAGFGGKGGLSAVDTSINNSPKYKGGEAGSGGGAGAYVKATVKTTPGSTYYVKVGYHGVPQNPSCNGSGGSNSCLNELGGGAKPGAGSNGYIKVTFK